MKKKSLRLLFTAVLAASLLAGCGSSKGMMNEYAIDSAAGAQAPAAMAEEYLYDAGYGEYEMAEAADEAAVTEEAPAEAGGADAQAEEIGENPQAGRKLITTMNISAETEYFDELMGNLEKQITDLGGYIENSSQWNGRSDYYGNRLENRSADLTIRIPAEKLESFLAVMEENSNITNKSKSVEDVTLAYVDLESHKKALLAEQERLLELMEMAETVEDLIAIEDKLANVRYQLESMESQLRTYDNKINYSTVNLNIQEVQRLTPPEEPTVWGRIKSGFSENLYAAGQDIQNFLIGIIINIPYILIWLVILAAVLLIVFLLAKYEKKKKAKRQSMKAAAGSAPVMQSGIPAEGKLPKQDPVRQAEGKLPMQNSVRQAEGKLPKQDPAQQAGEKLPKEGQAQQDETGREESKKEE